jgi:hypothetical protein
MIVKVQRPAGTHHGKHSLPWLVYAEGKRDMRRVTPTPRDSGRSLVKRSSASTRPT